MTIPHVRVHVPERALTSWLALDVSPSMTFGTADRRKADVAEGVALALGHVATQRGNRLGTITFGGRSDRRMPASGGRRGLLSALLAAGNDVVPGDSEPIGARSPATTLRFLAGVAPRGGLVVLISDFRGRGSSDWLTALAAVAARSHVLVVEIRDRREDELPDIGDLTLLDTETGREVRVDTSSRALRERFAHAAAEDRAALARDLRRLGVGHVVLSTSGSWLRSLASQLRLLRIAS